MTRFGTRTQKGAIDDGVNSAMRYYINNVEDLRRQQLIDTIIGLDQTRGGHALRRIDDSLKRRLKRVPDQEELPDFAVEAEKGEENALDEEETDFDEVTEFEGEIGERDEFEDLESQIEETDPFARLLENSESLVESSTPRNSVDDSEEMSFAESILADLRDARNLESEEESEREVAPSSLDNDEPLDEFIDDQIIQAPKEENGVTAETYEEEQVIFAPTEPPPSGSNTPLTSENDRVLHEIDELLSGVLNEMQDFRIHAEIREATDFLNVEEDDNYSDVKDDRIFLEEPTYPTFASDQAVERIPRSKASGVKSDKSLLKPKKRKTSLQRSKSRSKKPGASKVSTSLRKRRSSTKKEVSKVKYRSRALTGALLGAAILAWQVYLAKFSL